MLPYILLIICLWRLMAYRAMAGLHGVVMLINSELKNTENSFVQQMPRGVGQICLLYVPG
jgi:hypothetical protein